MEDIKEPTKAEDQTPIEEPKAEPKVEEPAKEEKKEPTIEDNKESTTSEEAKVDIEKLKEELNLANEKIKEVETLNTTIETVKADLEAKTNIIAEYEELLTNMVNTKMENVPTDYKDLIPSNMDLKQKLDWLNKAEAKGLFKTGEAKKPNVEIGKPMNVEPPQVDTSKLTTSQLLKMAYKSAIR